MILDQISLALRTPSAFVRTPWMKARVLSELQVLLSTPCYSESRMAMNRHPTVTEGVAYHLANCAAI